MDEADFAQLHSEHHDRASLERFLAAIPRGAAAEECEDCGGSIPEARRMAAPGCCRCLICQQRHERKRKER